MNNPVKPGGSRAWNDQLITRASEEYRMARIRFDFGTLTLEATLLDTPTAQAVSAALPLSSSVLTWGEEVYFEVPVNVARERGVAGEGPGRVGLGGRDAGRCGRHGILLPGMGPYASRSLA